MKLFTLIRAQRVFHKSNQLKQTETSTLVLVEMLHVHLNIYFFFMIQSPAVR